MSQIATRTDRPALSLFARSVKRIFDIAVALGALIFLLPVLLVVALAIKFETSGPVLFRQQRAGFNSKRFSIFKFRTMISNPDGNSGFHQARKRDPRVTRLGGFLRKSSIDELPQLLNVLLGDMSIVGPRPHVPQLSNQFADQIEHYYDRLNARPGLTGLAQISGLRGETETLAKMHERINHDLEYISKWSLRKDVLICVATARTAIGEDEAY